MRLFLAFAALLLLAGCTDEQIARLDAAAHLAEEKVTVTKGYVAKAEAAVKAAEELVAQLGIEKAKPVMEKANEALALAKDAQAIAAASAGLARDTADKAKKQQAAGAGTVEIIGTLIVGFLTGGAALLPKLLALGKAFRQTVAGIGTVRETLGEAEFQRVVAPQLAAAQDEKVKAMVDKLPGGQPA